MKNSKNESLGLATEVCAMIVYLAFLFLMAAIVC